MFGQTSIASKRQILFYTALDFSPVPAFADSYRQQKSVLPKIKLAHFYLAYAESIWC